MKEDYLIWCKAAGKWAPWVRPVPFLSVENDESLCALANPYLKNICFPRSDHAIILDLPSAQGVADGVELAKTGYRPVPLYNGTKAQSGAMPAVDNLKIESALAFYARQLSGIEFSEKAPPVFLLDSNRTHRFKLNPSVFDNSWDIYPQDMPPGSFLLDHGIDKMMVIGQKLNKDLKSVLKKYAKVGIKVYLSKGNDMKVKKLFRQKS